MGLGAASVDCSQRRGLRHERLGRPAGHVNGAEWRENKILLRNVFTKLSKKRGGDIPLWGIVSLDTVSLMCVEEQPYWN